MDWIRLLASAPNDIVPTPDLKVNGFGDLASLYGRLSPKFVRLMSDAARRWRYTRLTEILLSPDTLLMDRECGYPCVGLSHGPVCTPFGCGTTLADILKGGRNLSMLGIRVGLLPGWVTEALKESGHQLPQHHHRFAIGVTANNTCILGAY